eukprot:2941984-Rhodomonas_salina.1
MRVDFARQVRGLGVARVWKGVDCASDAGAQTNATLSSLKLLLLLNETQHANTMAAVNDVRSRPILFLSQRLGSRPQLDRRALNRT